MHEQKVVHNDLKGANILICADGTARICDFEMSVDLSGTLSRSMGGLGTVGFMAPEVLAWARAGFPSESDRAKLREDGQSDTWARPSAASDMYAFGVVALNMLHPPTPERYPETNPNIIDDSDHPGVKKWVTSLLSPQPSKRPTAINLHAETFFAVEGDKAALSAPLRAQTRPLARGCTVWAEIEERVQESLPQHVITSLAQIDNNELLADFNRQKELVANKPRNVDRGDSLDKRANVRRAFHGMAGGPDELKKIYAASREEGGFDSRLGRKGAYGRGSYFAEHAIYPAYLYPLPTQAEDGSITMLVADVILGESKDLGKTCEPELVREPPIECAGEVYDSVQGTENGFGIHRAGPQLPVKHAARPDARRHGSIAGGDEEYGR
eukprot:COSAG02_NODE_7086_length_3192_cov_1.085354_1_plen_382_part_10